MKHPDFQIDWLRTLVAVVDAGTISGAAPHLHRSQSAVSVQLKRLETALGRPVLSRGPRHLELTPAGAELLAYARQVLALQSQTHTALFGPALSGKVRLGVPDDYASAYLTPVLRSFAHRHLGVEIELTCEQSTVLIARVERGELDLALISRDRPQRGHFLFKEPLVWAGSAQFDTWRRDPLPIAVYEATSFCRIAALKALQECKRSYRIVYQSSNLAGQVAAVESGLAVAAWTRCSVPPGLEVLQNLPAGYELPVLPSMSVAVLRGKASRGMPAVDALYEQMLRTLTRATGDVHQ